MKLNLVLKNFLLGALLLSSTAGVYAFPDADQDTAAASSSSSVARTPQPYEVDLAAYRRARFDLTPSPFDLTNQEHLMFNCRDDIPYFDDLMQLLTRGGVSSSLRTLSVNMHVGEDNREYFHSSIHRILMTLALKLSGIPTLENLQVRIGNPKDPAEYLESRQRHPNTGAETNAAVAQQIFQFAAAQPSSTLETLLIDYKRSPDFSYTLGFSTKTKL